MVANKLSRIEYSRFRLVLFWTRAEHTLCSTLSFSTFYPNTAVDCPRSLRLLYSCWSYTLFHTLSNTAIDCPRSLRLPYSCWSSPSLESSSIILLYRLYERTKAIIGFDLKIDEYFGLEAEEVDFSVSILGENLNVCWENKG